MHTVRHLKIRSAPLLAVVLTAGGCAPGPPPPVFPALFGFGVSWLIVGLLAWIGVMLWKRRGPEPPRRTDYLTEAINGIHKRLNLLEDRIEQLEKRRDGKHG